MSDKSKAHAAALRQQRRRSKPGPMLWVVLALMGVAVVVMIASLSTQMGMGATPEFTATTLSGDTIQLSGYRGQVVMLNFWATWCPPCGRLGARPAALRCRGWKPLTSSIGIKASWF